MSRVGKPIETESRLVVPKTGAWGSEIESDWKQVADFFLGQWKYSKFCCETKIDYGDSYTILYTWKNTEMYILNIWIL